MVINCNTVRSRSFTGWGCALAIIHDINVLVSRFCSIAFLYSVLLASLLLPIELDTATVVIVVGVAAVAVERMQINDDNEAARR